MPCALRPGDTFPDIDLDDHAGNARSLRDLVGGDPTVLQFFRGWWCPKEQAFFRGLASLQDEAEVAYTRFVSVSVDEPIVQSAFRAGLGARWTFLADPDRRWQDQLGLVEPTDPGRPYLPTVFLLLPDLTIHSRYDGYWFWGRPTMEELRQNLRVMSMKVRPDWSPAS